MPDFNNKSLFDDKIYSISELNRLVRGMLERKFSGIQIEGEIASLAKPASGHLYFSLKDESSQVRCAMFRNRSLGMRFKPQNGDQVIATGKLSLYEARGDYQFIVDSLQPAGAGALQLAFEALKEKLHKEGLFDSARKKEIPVPAKKLAIITSPTGAAIQDILHVLNRRYPQLEVLIYPVPVQGDQAAPNICKALKAADKNTDCDLILLSRGGGSIEDLWAFNEETVARAVADCKTAIICGVGHEIDFTIADFAADVRAPTPSAAAELITPDSAELLQQIKQLDRSLKQAYQQVLQRNRSQLDWLEKNLQLQHPLEKIQRRGQRLDELTHRLTTSIKLQTQSPAQRLAKLENQLASYSPRSAIETVRSSLHQLQTRLNHSSENQLKTQNNQLEKLTNKLELLNPNATLQRGYAIIRDSSSGNVITSVTTLEQKKEITGTLADGEFTAKVEDSQSR